MEEKYCQSCGMPMGATDEMYGTEADGAKSSDYCSYCYENGQFTADVTMDEMIEACVSHMASTGSGTSEEEACSGMKEWFLTLKRWQ